MQHYLSQIPTIDRPTYKEVTAAKCKERYPTVYSEETAETFATMSKVKSPSSGIITTGLWPLDHESNYDWRQSSHQKSVWRQWIYMARIERIIVDRYRRRMFRNCRPASLIRQGLEPLLSPLCTPTLVTLSKSWKGDNTSDRTFYWPDGIKCEHISENDPQDDPFDIERTRAHQARKNDSEAMVVEITSLFKKLHASTAGLAIRHREGVHRNILKKLNDLEEVRNPLSPSFNQPTNHMIIRNTSPTLSDQN